MNFTREPVIETIITPKEGYKLLVRSSKAAGQEEYQVEAVEVVAFGHSLFFRSMEKPRAFLVPISDYEVVETKEARVVLKNAPIERAIKIGGGRETPPRPQREAPERREEQEEPAAAASEEASNGGQHPRTDRRRGDRRRHRSRRRGDRQERGDQTERTGDSERRDAKPDSNGEGGGASDETKVSSPVFTSLFPPPSTLISETISRYKEKDYGLSEGSFFSKPVNEEEKQKKEEKKKERDEESFPDGEGNQLSRVATTSSSMSFVQNTSFTSFTPPF